MSHPFIFGGQNNFIHGPPGDIPSGKPSTVPTKTPPYPPWGPPDPNFKPGPGVGGRADYGAALGQFKAGQNTQASVFGGRRPIRGWENLSSEPQPMPKPPPSVARSIAEAKRLREQGGPEYVKPSLARMISRFQQRRPQAAGSGGTTFYGGATAGVPDLPNNPFVRGDPRWYAVQEQIDAQQPLRRAERLSPQIQRQRMDDLRALADKNGEDSITVEMLRRAGVDPGVDQNVTGDARPQPGLVNKLFNPGPTATPGSSISQVIDGVPQEIERGGALTDFGRRYQEEQRVARAGRSERETGRGDAPMRPSYQATDADRERVAGIANRNAARPDSRADALRQGFEDRSASIASSPRRRLDTVQDLLRQTQEQRQDSIRSGLSNNFQRDNRAQRLAENDVVAAGGQVDDPFFITPGRPGERLQGNQPDFNIPGRTGNRREPMSAINSRFSQLGGGMPLGGGAQSQQRAGGAGGRDIPGQGQFNYGGRNTVLPGGGFYEPGGGGFTDAIGGLDPQPIGMEPGGGYGGGGPGGGGMGGRNTVLPGGGFYEPGGGGFTDAIGGLDPQPIGMEPGGGYGGGMTGRALSGIPGSDRNAPPQGPTVGGPSNKPGGRDTPMQPRPYNPYDQGGQKPPGGQQPPIDGGPGYGTGQPIIPQRPPYNPYDDPSSPLVSGGGQQGGSGGLQPGQQGTFGAAPRQMGGGQPVPLGTGYGGGEIPIGLGPPQQGGNYGAGPGGIPMRLGAPQQGGGLPPWSPPAAGGVPPQMGGGLPLSGDMQGQMDRYTDALEQQRGGGGQPPLPQPYGGGGQTQQGGLPGGPYRSAGGRMPMGGGGGIPPVDGGPRNIGPGGVPVNLGAPQRRPWASVPRRK